MVMDSGGRIFPCCISAPSDRRRLEFSTLENQNPFNDSLFKVSRALFSNPDQYRELVDKIPPPDRGPREPFCVKCPVIPDQRDLHRDNLMQRMKESSLFEAITDDTCTNLFSWNRV